MDASAFSFDAAIDRFVEAKASDLYLTVGAPATIRRESGMEAITENALTEEHIRAGLAQLLPMDAVEEFDSTLEFNTAIAWSGDTRLRINVFRQRQQTGLVIRRIVTQIPTVDELKLPRQYAELAMENRGLVLIVGPTGAGKSSSLAAMVDHRNRNADGHIVTIEDPVEFIHEHRRCIVTQRDVGIDTYSFGIALKNTLRQRPDVIVIGEIRDRETMEHATVFAETGHLCLATLHASNANQAVERIVNFFPEEKHRQILLSLALNLRGILSQRLVYNKQGSRTLAVEIMLNQGLVKSLIQEGKVKELKDIIERSTDQGMQSFDQCLFRLYVEGVIEESVALAEADNPANLRLQITQAEMARYSSGGAGSTNSILKRETGF